MAAARDSVRDRGVRSDLAYVATNHPLSAAHG
jgi:hypothetical protein